MKTTLFKLLALAFFSAALLSCKKDKKQDPVPTEIVEPSPIGTPMGQKSTKQIGPEGGSLSSGSGGITIDIPQGALSQNTLISIEPISSTNPAGAGEAYRLLPHGTKFAKPVKLTFSYAAAKNDIPLLDALTVAYQDGAGIWRISGDSQTDPAAETITVSTDHFSDWVPMKWLDLVPGNATLETGKKLTIKAVRYIPLPDENFLIVPLVPGKAKDQPVIKAVPLDNRQIVRWELGGPGSLESLGNSAVLTAPENLNSGSGAMVSLEVKSLGTVKRLLVSNITYVSDQYLMVRFDGGEWKSYFGLLNNLQGKYYSITGMVDPSDQFVPLVITWKKGEGVHNWTQVHERTNFVNFQYAYSTQSYIDHFYETYDESFVPSGGTLSIPKIDKQGGYTAGTFDLTSAGKWEGGDFRGKVKVEGKFKLKFVQF